MSYLVGVLLKGDASTYTTTAKALCSGRWKKYVGYRLELKCNSRAFMQAFNSASSSVLDREEVRIHGPYDDGHFILQYYAKDFVSWWRIQTLGDLKELINAFPIDYLRGRFDSDGNVNRYEVVLCGAESHRELMEFERSVCIRLGMRTGKLRYYGKPGQRSTIGKREIVTTQRKLRFSVNSSDFLHTIRWLNVELRNQRLRTNIRRRAWTARNADARRRAIELRTKFGWGYSRIAEVLSEETQSHLSPSTIFGWTSGKHVSWCEYDARR